MNLRFRFKRTLQASACLLWFDGNRMAYVRLLKLLYIADREWLAETGESITGDCACAMECGPVLLNLHDLIMGTGTNAGIWDAHILREGHAVVLVADPGRGELSKGIVNKLSEVIERYRQLSDWELSERTHEFQEWIKHYSSEGGRTPIPWQDILEAQGQAALISAVERDEAARQVFDDVFRP